MLSPEAEEQLGSHGISPAQVTAQIEQFRRGVPFAPLDRPATIGDGIHQLSREQASVWIKVFETNADRKQFMKFVPASGAATRMFRHLFELLEKGENVFGPVHQNILDNLDRFPFYQELKGCLGAKGLNLEDCRHTGHWQPIFTALLMDTCLNYAQLPKALLPFHSYGGHTRIALEEHLAESVAYATDNENIARIHFTVSPQHLEYIRVAVENKKKPFEAASGVTIHGSFSTQKNSTDTLAVDLQNNLATNDDGTLIFRPGGHGALLENLNELDTDLVFIKNIDNVVPEYRQADTVFYKKALAGFLLAHQAQVASALQKLESNALTSPEWNNLLTLMRDQLSIDLPASLNFNDAGARKVVFDLLNRPMRVCGMVPNEGEPGGGPFWVKDTAGKCSLQVVETAQVNATDPTQAAIIGGATHFNPVDLVCYIRDYKGNKFDLLQFRDNEACFISEKSLNGKPVKALELPGLWNGAMANWITVFVEVPLSTFNPVKSVSDLLKEGHQPLA